MPSLNRDHRRLLENTVAQARTIAVDGARKVLTDQYAVHHHEPWPHMTSEERELRNQLRAHGRQLGDRRDDRRDTQETEHLVQACAYEHWHRMLFARFLAENDLLLDADHGMAMSLDEVRELAREQNRDWLEIAADLAQKMLLAVFRPDDPVLQVSLPPETRQKLEGKLDTLPAEVFRADDSLGWVYQFWQRDEKDRVNKSEVKIGADELPAVTQLFTEDYMVLFLLENTLGAWWTAKRRAEGKDPALPGYEWTYLQLNEDGTPTAGGFSGWPRSVRDLRILDPCMGSGHFLTFALPILARMRIAEEELSLQDAVTAVLRDNLYGLELDARCSQIAAFNLALAAWRLGGEHFSLPELNMACSGLGINACEADWVKLAGSDGRRQDLMAWLYSMFKMAPLIGSLIDPRRLGKPMVEDEVRSLLPLLEQALSNEAPANERRELLITAQGVVAAARLLSRDFTLVVTNVPYLGRSKQHDDLKTHCDAFHGDAKTDLATTFVDRSLRARSNAGTVALVSAQGWLFQPDYRALRARLLNTNHWDFVARLGPRAFETISGEVVNVALITISQKSPSIDHLIPVWDVSELKTPAEKSAALKCRPAFISQRNQLENPGARVVLNNSNHATRLKAHAKCVQGLATSDDPQFVMKFWELPALDGGWEGLMGTVEATVPYGGREQILRWEDGQGQYYRHAQALKAEGRLGGWKSGTEARGKRGVLVSQMSQMPVTLYTGEFYDHNASVIVPYNEADLASIWAYCSSSEFFRRVRELDQSTKPSNNVFVEIPFDLMKWRQVAADDLPEGIPEVATDDLTQWIFDGHPNRSNHVLHVATARLVGYRWPRQAGSSFLDCPAVGPDGLEAHADDDGIVTLGSLAGEASAASRMRVLLSDSYGSDWSAAKLVDLLGDCESLEVWLRDRFFQEHCQLFHQRPFVWHIWDGRRDGFHALVNYHKLAASNGEGRKTLEKLVFTYLGDWISRQQADLGANVEGADGRLIAALHLKAELEKILAGEKPYDLFVRWKPLHEQPVGWAPDINDGVRLNIRPWLATNLAPSTKPKKGACVLRVTPKISYGKDRGKEPHRTKEDFPWFWSWDEQADDFLGGKDFDGARWNELHYSLEAKRRVRDRRKQAGANS